MKIKFTGVPGEPEIEEITMFGYSFPKGKAVDVPDSDKLAQMKLSNHPHFKGGDVPQETLILPQTIPSVENSMLVSDGHEAVTEQERNAVNTLSEMEGLQKVHSYEEILEAKGESHGDDFRVSPPSAAKTDGAKPRTGRKS